MCDNEITLFVQSTDLQIVLLKCYCYVWGTFRRSPFYFVTNGNSTTGHICASKEITKCFLQGLPTSYQQSCRSAALTFPFHYTYTHTHTLYIYPPLFLPIEIRIKRIPKALARVIESQLLINAINLSHVLSRELKVARQVGLYARRGFRFGEHGVALCDAPAPGDLRAGLVVFLTDFDEYGVVLYIYGIIILVIAFMDGWFLRRGERTISLPIFFPLS